MKDIYLKTVAPALQKELNLANVHQIPKVTKVVVNAGVGRAALDTKKLEAVVKGMREITGQAPVITKAKKSIAGFKLREGMSVGVSVTLRGDMMYEFMDRLVSVALPRVRDFRGISKDAFDGHGNYSLGLREHGVFAEIPFEEASEPFGLQVNISTTAPNDEQAKALLTHLGFPFKG
jgi:large subunit ribosomal protein L5